MTAPAEDAVDQMVAQWRRERADLDPSSMALFARLTRAHLAASRAIDATLDRHGLKRGEFDVLASLRRAAAPFRLSPGDLARAMVLSPAATTHRVQLLEGRGLVVRRPDPADGRYGVVELTEAGRELVDRAVADHVAGLDRMLADVPPADRQRLTELLAAVERAADG
ncbi:MarR family winged helix-turn-helix transcriptional regulator [Geodermatophilus sp. SYSU D00815]